MKIHHKLFGFVMGLRSASYLTFIIIQILGPAKWSKLESLFCSLEFAPNGNFILVLDGIDKILRNKTSELRQNIIKNSRNYEVKPCFK